MYTLKRGVNMKFKLDYEEIDLTFDNAYCIGYSGRNVEKTKEHIAELKELGVPEPNSVPEIYHLDPLLFRQNNLFQLLVINLVEKLKLLLSLIMISAM